MNAERHGAPPRARLYVSRISEYDWLTALEFGRVDEGQPEEAWQAVSERFGYLWDDERCVGFKLLGLNDFDLEHPDHDGVWNGPRFDAPVLALADVSAGEIVLAARVHFQNRSSLNREHFNAAVAAGRSADEIASWTACAESGDSMAHFGLGVALFEAGQPQRAYTHLRFYATIAAHEPWAQYWYARSAGAVGERGEALDALDRAIELGGDENLIRTAVRLRAEIADAT